MFSSVKYENRHIFVQGEISENDLSSLQKITTEAITLYIKEFKESQETQEIINSRVQEINNELSEIDS